MSDELKDIELSDHEAYIQLAELFTKVSEENDALRAQLEQERKDKDAWLKEYQERFRVYDNLLAIAVTGLKKVKMHAHDEYPKGTKKECAGCIAEETLRKLEER